ncbi:TSUP family transporter [Sphingobium sufflavum]|uniref:TSUP family transporter n=1 Tax=Sphingobium sufflavum TaxID=1129547 RepID=UPI001F2A197A|nr:TSUP family transporter [Sphingobium sufflavum]MCE7797442.1 TSUP family transporter [Sphingobium sufflavum]
MIALSIDIYAAMTVAATAAGFIDAIAGGGGLITVPALLAAGIPPFAALGTNKLQSSFSVAMSCYRFARTGLVDFRGHVWTVLLIFVAAFAGALAVQSVSNAVLGRVMPLLIIGVVAYVLLSPRMTDDDSHDRLGWCAYAPLAGGIGFYDGFFGPGAGSFYSTSLVALRGMGLTRAAANTKLFNFTSNFAALVLFALGGHVLWLLGLVMAVGAMAGAWIGSHVAIRFGARVIRPLLVTISLILTGKLVWENFF